MPGGPQVRVSTNLRVYVMALEVDNSELLRVLKPSLPLERLHLDSYHTLVSDATLELISQQYNKTLTHFLLLRDDPDFPDLTVNRNEDPLVLLAWRCTQLAVLVIHGESVFYVLGLAWDGDHKLSWFLVVRFESSELFYAERTH